MNASLVLSYENYYVMTGDKITKYKKYLNAQRDELRRQIILSEDSRKPVELDQQSIGRLSRQDALQQQAMAKATDARRVVELQKIGAALARMDEGEFGWCAECGEPIAEKRLDIDPTVLLCVSCVKE